ncbi:small ubiquitin-related modifier 2-like isoform X3 [Aphis craccivora]|uniref:Small ubiquitin-related modifier 2-like isoform X3 n=1 Tax=Aphis craccivora TaxID=307492 RepID=A0A6G0VWV9_APHCR|nr:small ubiquitin-related modifier 2-like isoform X3 [Aphis craccivora]
MYADCITLNIMGLKNNIVYHFTVKKHILFAKLMNAYCEVSVSKVLFKTFNDVPFNTINFNFDGRAINEMDTPISLDLVDGDTIEVFRRENGGGYF